METVTTNLTGKTRREKLHGRDYLVAPLVLLTEGVLNGSKGALFYPEPEISRDPTVWNHMPIVAYHPMRDGQPVSARDPEVLEKQGLGFVFRSGYQGKLAAEAWFDQSLTQRYDRALPVDARVWPRLERGIPIELSTGLYTENELAANGANYRGKSYQFVAKNYRPDHVAVLPDQIGACSIKDGCGVLVNQATDPGYWAQVQQRLSEALGLQKSTQRVHVQGEWMGWTANADAQPSEELDITAEKACKILKDGQVHGKPLTKAQRGMFGAKCGERDEGQATANRLARGLQIVANWCNQYGGTTCKDGRTGPVSGKKAAATEPAKTPEAKTPRARTSTATVKIEAPAEKVARIETALKEAKQRVATLSQELKAAKADMAAVKEQVKKEVSSRVMASQGKVESVAKQLNDLSEQWLSEAMKGSQRQGPTSEEMVAEVNRLANTVPVHALAKALGIEARAKNKEAALVKIRAKIIGRAGAVARVNA